MNLITLDFETYYAQDYTLKKLTTEQYIRDPRFQTIGVGVKINGDKAGSYDGKDIHGYLKQFNIEDNAVLAHHAAFDCAILNWRYGIKPKLIFDSMSMARPVYGHSVGVSLEALVKELGLGFKGNAVHDALGKRREDFTDEEIRDYMSYCRNDVDLTYKLFNKLRPTLPDSELHVIDSTVRMFSEPVFYLNKKLLEDHLVDVVAKKEALIASLSQEGEDPKKILMSNPKFAEALRAQGVEPPTKISAKTGEIAFAFSKKDEAFLELQEHENPMVQALVAARLGVKSTLEETRTKAFIAINERGKLPVYLHYWGAHPGRFSGGDKVNLQNLPRGGKLRESIEPPPGCVLVVSDLAQIEARMLAYVAKQNDLVEAFRQKRDIYSEFATDIYERPITKAQETERFVGKTGILGLGYYCGHAKFRGMLATSTPSVVIDDDEARRIVRLYRTKNEKIVRFWYRMGDILSLMAQGESGQITDHMDITFKGETIQLEGTLPITYRDLRLDGNSLVYSSKRGVKSIYSGKAVENLIQYLARKAIVEMMVRIKKRYPAALQVHDELVFAVREEEAEETKAFVTEVMSRPPSWAPGLPVACETKIGRNYKESK